MKKIIPLCLLLSICFSGAFAQHAINTLNAGKTANRGEILSNIFLSVTSTFSQSDGDINFKATPFGVISNFNKKWLSDQSYVDNRFLRNIQVNAALTPKDNSIFKFQKGSLGLTISLINKSDKTIADYYSVVKKFANISGTINEAVKTTSKRIAVAGLSEESILIRVNSSIVKFNKSQDTLDLDPTFRKVMREIIGNVNIADFLLADNVAIKGLQRRVSNGSLVTVTPTIIRNFDKSRTEAISYKADWQFGLRNDIEKKPWQVEFSGIVKTERDTIKTTSNLDHFSAVGSGGINFVLMQDKDSKSLLELKPYFEYTRVFKGRYEKEDANTYNANMTLRLRLAEDTWLPLTVKLDLKKPQLFGFLTIFWAMK